MRLHDFAQVATAMGAGPYGISDASFIEYLHTLAIQNYDGNGTEKPAFSVIQDNLGAREG